MNETWLAHHGIKGQKWGVRRFENPDGSLTEAGKKRYGKDEEQKGSEKKEKLWTDNKKKIAKRIATGAAFVAAAGIGAYAYTEHVEKLASMHAMTATHNYLNKAFGSFVNISISDAKMSNSNAFRNANSYKKSKEYINGIKQNFGKEYWKNWKKQNHLL